MPACEKLIKTRGHFPNDEAATKLPWRAQHNNTATWSRAGHVENRDDQFAILHADRFSAPNA